MDKTAMEDLVTRDVFIQAQIDVLTKEKTEIRKTLVGELGLGTHLIAGYQVIVSQPAKWTTETKALFASEHPETENPNFYLLQLDTKTVEQHLAPVDVARYKLPAAKQVQVRGGK
jgi:hypothetical protein